MATPAQRQANEENNGVGVTGVFPRGAVFQAESEDPRPIRLAKLRTVADLWQEWMHGIGGNRPARLIHREIRAPVHNTYKKRKNVYILLAGLVRNGQSPAQAIKMVNDFYPRCPLVRSTLILLAGLGTKKPTFWILFSRVIGIIRIRIVGSFNFSCTIRLP